MARTSPKAMVPPLASSRSTTAAQVAAAREERLKKLRAVSIVLDAVSSPVRLALLWQLEKQEMPAGSLSKALGMSPPTISHHLTLLRLSGIVEARREGRSIFYRPTELGCTLMKVASMLAR